VSVPLSISPPSRKTTSIMKRSLRSRSSKSSGVGSSTDPPPSDVSDLEDSSEEEHDVQQTPKKIRVRRGEASAAGAGDGSGDEEDASEDEDSTMIDLSTPAGKFVFTIQDPGEQVFGATAKQDGTQNGRSAEFFFLRGYLPVADALRRFSGNGTLCGFALGVNDNIKETFKSIQAQVLRQLKTLHAGQAWGSSLFKGQEVVYSALMYLNMLKFRLNLKKVVVKITSADDGSVVREVNGIEEKFAALSAPNMEMLVCYVTAQVYTMKKPSVYGTTCGLTLSPQQIFIRPVSKKSRALLESKAAAGRKFKPAASADKFM
jgi:hypothetical protein